MINKNIDDQTPEQVRILNELAMISKVHGIAFWISGGWAIDFIVGEITRTHDDIDLVLWINDRKRFEAALVDAGYKQHQVGIDFRDRQTDFVKNNIYVQIGYITNSMNGDIIMNGLPEWIWRADSLNYGIRNLLDISMQIIHPKQLLEEKEVYEQIGRPYREKDAISKKILKEVILE